MNNNAEIDIIRHVNGHELPVVVVKNLAVDLETVLAEVRQGISLEQSKEMITPLSANIAVATADLSVICRGDPAENIQRILELARDKLVFPKTLYYEVATDWQPTKSDGIARKELVLKFIRSMPIIDIDAMALQDPRIKSRVEALYNLQPALAKSIAYKDFMSEMRYFHVTARATLSELPTPVIDSACGKKSKRVHEYLVDRVWNHSGNPAYKGEDPGCKLTPDESGLMRFIFKELLNQLPRKLYLAICDANARNGHYTEFPGLSADCQVNEQNQEIIENWSAVYVSAMRDMYRRLVHDIMQGLKFGTSESKFKVRFGKAAKTDIQLRLLPALVTVDQEGYSVLFGYDGDFGNIICLDKHTKKIE